MFRFVRLRSVILCPLLVLPLVVAAPSIAQTEVLVSDRTEIVYFIGQVTKNLRSSSVINLGELHTLNLIDKSTKEPQVVSIFRPSGSVLRPVGVAKVIESQIALSSVKPDALTIIQEDDVVIFVRQMNELDNPEVHSDSVLRSNAVRQKRPVTRRTSSRNNLARLLEEYRTSYPRWQKSRSDVVGHFFARPELKMTGNLERLLKQVDMFRRFHADGIHSIAAAGDTWQKVMKPLLGEDARIRFESAASVKTQDIDDEEEPLNVSRLRSLSDAEFFDSTDEQKSSAAFLAAAALRIQPRNLEQWLRIHFLFTQFPDWQDNDAIIERIVRVTEAMAASD